MTDEAPPPQADRDQMVARQRILAEFGDTAHSSDDLDEILTEACRLVAKALGTNRAKILEIEDDGKTLFLRAGVGWQAGIIGKLRLSMKEHSSESFSIGSGEPVFTKDISKEDRFTVPEFMKDAGVVAMVNAPIFLPGRKAYGLLQVDSREPRDFGAEDAEFLRTYTTILGPVIDRVHKAHSLREALDANKRLLQELQHRIKNHIALIMSVIHLRSKQAKSHEARDALSAVGERIETLRLLHEQLYVAGSTERLRLRPFVMQLVERLCHLHESEAGKVRLDFAIEKTEVAPDVAVPFGLIVNEFVTNSLKYAFDGKGGRIGICIDVAGSDRLQVRLSDDGKGLGEERSPKAAGSGTGMKLIDGLARQIGAQPDWSGGTSGTTLRLEFDSR